MNVSVFVCCIEDYQRGWSGEFSLRRWCTSEQRPKWNRGASQGKGKPVQRPWGRNKLCVLEKHPHRVMSDMGRNRVRWKVLNLGALWLAVVSPDAEGLSVASGVLGLFPSLPLASLVVLASVSFWVGWWSPCLPCSFVLRTKDMTHDLVPYMWGEIYSFYPYNWRCLGMVYMLLTESHRESKYFFKKFSSRHINLTMNEMDQFLENHNY